MPKKTDLKKDKEFLLIYVDESDEFIQAMKYACNIAKSENLGIILLYVIQEEKFRHWQGVENIMREEGVAILKPGQYRGSHKLRLHQGKYMALGQQKPVKVYRDNNRDANYDLDESKTDTGLFGINIHRATARKGGKSTRVDKW